MTPIMEEDEMAYKHCIGQFHMQGNLHVWFWPGVGVRILSVSNNHLMGGFLHTLYVETLEMHDQLTNLSVKWREDFTTGNRSEAHAIRQPWRCRRASKEPRCPPTCRFGHYSLTYSTTGHHFWSLSHAEFTGTAWPLEGFKDRPTASSLPSSRAFAIRWLRRAQGPVATRSWHSSPCPLSLSHHHHAHRHRRRN